MSSVPGVTVTGQPGATTGGTGVPDTEKPSTVPSGPSGPPTVISAMKAPSSSSSTSPPEPPLTPQELSTPTTPSPTPFVERPAGTPKGTQAPGQRTFLTRDQEAAQAQQQEIKDLGFTPGAEFPSAAEVNAKVTALGIKYESQTGNLVNGVITTGGGSPRDIYVQSLLTEVAQGYKGQGFADESSYLSNRLQQVGLAYNPQSKTITDPLLIGIISEQRANQNKGGYAGISFGSGETSGIVGPSTALSLKLGSSLGQEATGYITRYQESDLTSDLIKQGVKAGDIKLQYSSDQVKALTQPITEYGNIPNFFDKNNTGTSATPNPALTIISEPGGPITKQAAVLGSIYGQVALGQLVRNTPFEASTLSSEAQRALVYNPTTAIYGNKPELQTPPSRNPTNYTLNLKETLNIGEKLNPSVTSTIPINSPLLARQLTEQANRNIEFSNAVSKLTLQSDISKFVNTESSKGVKQISIYDVVTGANIGKVQANQSGIDVINEIAQKQQIYLKDYVDPFVKAQQVKQSNESRNEIVSYIGEAQTLGLKINLIDKSGKLISTVPSESGYHSLVGAEKGGNAISISKTAPQTAQEITDYLSRQSNLMLSNTKNNTEDQNTIDLIRGAISAGTVIGFGLIGTLISLPQNTHALLEKGNSEFYGNNDVFTNINNLVKPSGIAADIFTKAPLPESVTQDILNLQVPKESANYLIGEGLVEGGLVVQQLKEGGIYASQLASKAGPIVKGLVARTFDTTDLITLPNAKAETGTSATGRTTGTFKNLNMMRNPVPKDVFGFDTVEITRFSKTPKIPTNPLLEDLSKEVQTRNTGIQNKLLEPSQPKPLNPNQKPISLDPFYKPSKTVSTSDLQGINPPEDLTGGTAPIKKPISNPLDATTANQVPGVTITGQPGASTGGVGVPDVFQSKSINEYIDSLQIPRSSIVEQTRIKPENEVFNFEGKRLETNFGSVFSKDPLGLLRKERLESNNLVQTDPFYRPGKGLGILSGEVPLEEQAARLAPIENNYPFENTNLSRSSRIESERNLFDIKGKGALIKPENEPRNVELDPFYRNIVPMKSLGATNKISKNIAKVDVESLLNIERIKPDLSDFMNIGKERVSKFTETNIYLGRGLGFISSKGEGGLFTRPSPPTPPTDPFKSEVPKGFKAIESGGTLTLQKLEEEVKPEVIQEPKQKQKQEGELVSLGTGPAQLVKTKQLIKPKQLEKPKYVLINQLKQKQKQEGILITVPKQGQKQSEKIDQLLKQKLKLDQTFKQQSDQLFKPIQAQKLEQPQLFKQEEQGKQIQDLIFSPKTLQAQDQKLIQETIQTTKPKPKEPPIPPGLIFAPAEKKPKKKKLTKKEEEFIGNASDVQIEGLYKRNEVTLGVKTIDKLVGKDYARGYKEYKNKIKDPFSRKNKRL